MKLPRDLSGAEIITILKRFGYEVVRQKGSHVQLVRRGDRKHTISVPMHDYLKVGTLHTILTRVSLNLGLTIDQILKG